MGQLLSEWKAVQNWRAPVLPLPPMQREPKTNSVRHPREDIVRYMEKQSALLAPRCGRAIAHAPRPRGIPVVINADGVATV